MTPHTPEPKKGNICCGLCNADCSCYCHKGYCKTLSPEPKKECKHGNAGTCLGCYEYPIPEEMVKDLKKGGWEFKASSEPKKEYKKVLDDEDNFCGMKEIPSPSSGIELKYCQICVQMTNWSEKKCLKCENTIVNMSASGMEWEFEVTELIYGTDLSAREAGVVEKALTEIISQAISEAYEEGMGEAMMHVEKRVSEARRDERRKVEERLTDALNALESMYMQYCGGGHMFMNAGESASLVLERENILNTDDCGIPLTKEK